MTKLKNPLLSIGARGTISNALTFQKRGQTTIVREKPIPAYRRTLPQVYQRWLYEDYAYLWTQQTTIIKRQYAAWGSKYHLTGFQEWMSQMLRHLPDIAGMWHLDERSGSIAKDFSRNSNDGVIYGATPTDGIISGAQYFILNDYIAITTPNLNFTSQNFSLIIRARVDDLTNVRRLFVRGQYNMAGYLFRVNTAGALRMQTSQPGQGQSTDSPNGTVLTARWYTLAFTRNGASVRLYKDGLDVTSAPAVHANPASTPAPAYIGIDYDHVSYPMQGKIDELIIFNRALDATEILRHSKRRYPP